MVGHDFDIVLVRGNGKVRGARDGLGKWDEIGNEDIGAGFWQIHRGFSFAGAAD